MSWETSSGDLIFAEVDSETLAFIIQIDGDAFTAMINRSEAEGLAVFLAEWCGFPLYYEAGQSFEDGWSDDD